MNHRVYLSGPICGLTFRQATEWRREITGALYDYDIDVFNPMRDVSIDDDSYVIDETSDNVASVDASLLTDRGMVARDFNDVCRSDLIIVNLLEAKRVSIGTVSELAWAYDRKIPTLVIMEEHGNIHDHPFVREFTSYRVNTKDQAVEVAVSILGASLW